MVKPQRFWLGGYESPALTTGAGQVVDDAARKEGGGGGDTKAHTGAWLPGRDPSR